MSDSTYAQPVGKHLTGKPVKPEITSKKAITSLLFGIVSIVFAFLTGIIAIVFGIAALLDITQQGSRLKGKGIAITGIVLGALGCLWTIPLILVALLLPAVHQVRAAAQRVTAMNDIRVIALAMHQYSSDHGVMPLAPEHIDSQLSWRVHLLPYLDENDLYSQFHLDESWNSEHNLKLLEQMPPIYQNMSLDLPLGETNYLIPITIPDSSTDWQQNRSLFVVGKPGPRIAEITDGTILTIMILEVNASAAVPWTKPNADWVFDPNDPLRDLGEVRRNLFLAVMADASVQSIPNDTSPQELKAMFTRDAGDNAF